MNPPKFSVCVLCRNSAATLPRLFDSLKEFLARNGDLVVVDTGSSDTSAALARAAGARVFEVGERFLSTIDGAMATAINKRFVVEGEKPVVAEGDKLFDFAKARNHAADLAVNDWVSWADSDEAFTVFDIDRINAAIEPSDVMQCDYEFVFAHGPDGRPEIAFRQSKMYDRTRVHWNPECIVHEVLCPIGAQSGHTVYLPPDVFYLEHWQLPSDHRSRYLPGLALDCWLHPENDRNSHYLSRELLWTGRPRSAIKEFERHVAMNRWPAEKAQSLIFMGDCYGAINDPEKQLACYHRAFDTDWNRREALMRLAGFHRFWNHPQAVVCYAAAALQIPWNNYYANTRRQYEDLPHSDLAWAYGWLGRVPEAREHLLKALEYQPYNPEYLGATKFYCEYPDQGIEGWMLFPELTWLYETAKKYKSICELGSWKGRSTHALCTGASIGGGHITAVDHFQGSDDERDLTREAAKHTDVYGDFCKNTAGFTNLTVIKQSCEKAVEDIPDGAFEVVFIDAEHSYQAVCRDIKQWLPKATKILCGHDYMDRWPELKNAVRDTIGQPDEVHGTIWVKYLPILEPGDLLAEFGHKIRAAIPFSVIKHGDGENLCMAGTQGGNCDGHPYSPQLAQALREAYEFFKGAPEAKVLHYSDQKTVNCLYHRTDNDLAAVKQFWGTIRDAKRPKLFIGPSRLSDVAGLLRASFRSIPLVNAFADYPYIGQQVLAFAANHGNCIIVFSAGMMSKVLIADVLRRFRDVTCIDAGSTWDPLFVPGGTRTVQAPQETLQALYADWLEQPCVP